MVRVHILAFVRTTVGPEIVTTIVEQFSNAKGEIAVVLKGLWNSGPLGENALRARDAGRVPVTRSFLGIDGGHEYAGLVLVDPPFAGISP
jgi:hypothetical protein